MNNLSYKDFLLSFLEHISLLRINFFGISDRTAFSDSRKYLRRYNLIQTFLKRKGYQFISDNGKMYLRYHSRSFWKFAIPTTISIIALFGGYGVYQNPALKGLLEAIASLLGRIMGSLGIGT